MTSTRKNPTPTTSMAKAFTVTLAFRRQSARAANNANMSTQRWPHILRNRDCAVQATAGSTTGTSTRHVLLRAGSMMQRASVASHRGLVGPARPDESTNQRTGIIIMTTPCFAKRLAPGPTRPGQGGPDMPNTFVRDGP